MFDAAEHPHTLVFVEVKYRKTDHFGRPEESVTTTKQRRIAKAARHYLCSQNKDDSVTRFDVIAVTQPNYLPHIRWIKNAFV